MEVIGVLEAEGLYQGNPWHNINFHCVRDADGIKGVGQLSQVEKVKVARLEECFGAKVTIDDVKALKGERLSFGYDKWGQVNQIRVIPRAPAESAGA
ncbi:MAG: hypothetical protein FWH05_09280 [Oscillospiraceae bacterium]|nr:hypothetical protein [Oscillospiraceae bacterium]